MRRLWYDFSPLEENAHRTRLATAWHHFGSIVKYCFFDAVHGDGLFHIDDEEVAEEAILQPDLRWIYLQGSAVDGPEDVEFMPTQCEVDIAHLTSYLSRPELSGTIGIMEVFGGKSGVIRIAIRRRLKIG